jgi:tetratricopeptide (TPR) repeat protein
MALSPELTPRQKFVNTVSNALERGRTPLLIVIGAAIVIVIVFAIYTQIAGARADKAAGLAATIQTDFSSWGSETDKTKKADLQKTLTSEIDGVVKKFPRSYGAQRALFIRADMAYEEKDWKNAVADYELVAKRFPSSYLAPVCLANAAAASEQLGDQKQAIALNKQILDFKGLTPELPRALFSLGRLSEEIDNTKDAATYYNQLINTYPSSGWTNLARDRIIYLAAKASVAGSPQTSAPATQGAAKSTSSTGN